MNKLKILLVIAALIIGGGNVAWADDIYVYLIPGAFDVDKDNDGNPVIERYALYMFNNNDNNWCNFTEIDGSGLYRAVFDSKYTGMIICRMDGNDDGTNNFDNSHRWNQTGNITGDDLPSGSSNIIYKITSLTGNTCPYTRTSLPLSSLAKATSFSNGKYLFKNVATGKYLGPANVWGTHASLIEPTYYNTIEIVTAADGKYKIESQVENGGSSHYLGISGGDLYMDNSGTYVYIKECGDNKYALSLTDGVSFITYDGSSTTLDPHYGDPANSTNAQWEIIPYATAVSDLSSATMASPKDATFLVENANFDRNSRYSWTKEFTSEGWESYNNTGHGTGNAENCIIGTWASNGRRIKVSQSLTSLPEGIYKITCQGFYRDGNKGTTDDDRNAYLYANTQSSPLMSINAGASNSQIGAYQKEIGSTGKYVPDSESDASIAFSDGDYSDNEVYAYVSDGNLEIGIRKEKVKAENWLAFDNFRLWYCGTLASAAASASAASPVNMTYMINNPSASFDVSGWTNVNTSRYDGTVGFDHAPGFFNVSVWSESASSWSSSTTQTVSSLPEGIYRVRAAGQQSTDDTTLEMIINSGTPIEFDHNGSTNGTINISGEEVAEGSGWKGWRYKTSPDLYINNGNLTILFQSSNQNNAAQTWANIDDVELFYLGNPYPALETAIGAAESHKLGFDDGEYAPYNNVASLTAVDNATTMYTSKTATAADVETTTASLGSLSWTTNVGEVDAIYNGNFSEGDPGSSDILQYGWTRTNGWGQFQKNISGTYSTAYYNQTGSLQYGNAGKYTMPLNANTIYELTFAYRSHEVVNSNGSNDGMTISVLNGSGEGLTSTEYSANKSNTEWVCETKSFCTGTEGDYVLTIGNTGNTWITGVTLRKATIPMDEEVTYTPTAGNAHVTLTRTFNSNSNNWNSFVVPFDIDNTTLKAKFGNGVQVAEVANPTSDLTTTGIKFTPMGTPAITANTPVIIKGVSEAGPYTFNNVLIKNETPTIANATSGTSFVGNYNQELTLTSGWYYINNNLLKVSDGTSKMKAFRAYITTSGIGGGSRLSMIIDGEDTSVDAVVSDVADGKIYNLQGQRVSTVQKGLFIKDGKKVVIK